MDFSYGNYINNTWVKPDSSTTIQSINPATAGQVVMEAPSCPEHARLAAKAAGDAWPEWAALPTEKRLAALRRFARELSSRIENLARAITAEMGKPLREARLEAQSLINRIDLVANQQLPTVKSWQAPGVDGECRYHPLGVIAVLGPYNFPLHLCHAHIMPALATGNTVVVKPSERTPLSFQRYMEAWQLAGLPPVLQMVQGGKEVGQALIDAPEIKGVALTGSWKTGHTITRHLLDRPEVLVALEMGGQNMAIVLEDADLDQALEGVLLGAFLTTGQRCTCTSRLLLHKNLADAFIPRLIQAASELTFGDPLDNVFMGPMASYQDRNWIDHLCEEGRKHGAKTLLEAKYKDGGAYRGPSIHLIDKNHDSLYTQEEVFGPDLAVILVDDLDDAIETVNRSAYGLSLSLFSADKSLLEKVYLHTRVGCINWNRSTSRASGAFPFGGLGRSGNYRPAGSAAVHYTTYPVQMLWNEAGQLEDNAFIRDALTKADPVFTLEVTHRLEEALEAYGVYPDISVPEGRLSFSSRQLDGPKGKITLAFIERLKLLSQQIQLHDETLVLRLPTGLSSIKALARDISNTLYGLRSLWPQRFLSRRPRGSHVPGGEKLSLPRSEAYMARLVASDFVPDDKKPPVIDLLRSSGAYLASIDEDPLVLFDAAGQIATHAGGLNPPAILEALATGEFSDSIANNSPHHPIFAKMANELRSLAPSYPWVKFSNSGAEANEIALAVCAEMRPGKKAIVAFRGAFHGRTLLAIHSTWNPAKRLRFELEGHACRWLDLPQDNTPHVPKAEPEKWLSYWESKERNLEGLPKEPLLQEEVQSLLALEEALRDDEVMAILVEPMQSEGGERYASPRFFRALSALAHLYQVPFIMDEVQCGFFLGGPFFWHSRFNLPYPPTAITSAKKAQVGVTLSSRPIPFETESQAASVVRGFNYLKLLESADPGPLMEEVDKELQALVKAFPQHVLHPRLTGWSFGFDFSSKECLAFVVGERLFRGYMVYGAGDRGLRFRFHPEITRSQVTALFQRLNASIESFIQSEDKQPHWLSGQTQGLTDLAPSWPNPPSALPAHYQLKPITKEGWPKIREAYEKLQEAVYEPARRDDFELLSAFMETGQGLGFAIFHAPNPPSEGLLVGACLAFPLELFASIDGPNEDPTLGSGRTLYSADLTIHPQHQGKHLGRILKTAQLEAAMNALNEDGQVRYDFLTGRNRVGLADAMARIVQNFGAWVVKRYLQQYGEKDGKADYYRIPLTWPRLPLQKTPSSSLQTGSILDFENGLCHPLGSPQSASPEAREMRDAFQRGHLTGALVNKLSLCNFVTPGLTRAYEWLRESAPKTLGHLILASGRAETLDKTLRSFKYHRKDASIALALGPVYAGTTTAAARSLSLPLEDPKNFFAWPTLPDPTLQPEATLEALKEQLETQADKILGIFLESTYLKTARSISNDTWLALRQLSDQYKVPLALIENTTGAYRSGLGPWKAAVLPVPVDAVLYHPNGQLGLAFVSDAYYVSEKLTLISTWDGDELALTRFLWEMRLSRGLPISEKAKVLRSILEPLGEVSGEGLYLGLHLHEDAAKALIRRLNQFQIRVKALSPQSLVFAPALNISDKELERLKDALKDYTP